VVNLLKPRSNLSVLIRITIPQAREGGCRITLPRVRSGQQVGGAEEPAPHGAGAKEIASTFAPILRSHVQTANSKPQQPGSLIDGFPTGEPRTEGFFRRHERT